MSAVEAGVDSVPDLAPKIPQIEKAKLAFVARYYSRNARKTLTLAEAQKLSAAGISIVSIWEAAAMAPLEGMLDGATDAGLALVQAKAVEQPAGTAIYFAVDFDATTAQIAGPVTGYFKGVDMALAGKFTVGVYGSGAVIAAMKAAGLAAYGWLSGAGGWNGSKDFDGWDIKQGLPADPYGFGFDIDADQARGDFGAWRLPPS